MRSCDRCGASLKLGARACSKCNMPAPGRLTTWSEATRTVSSQFDHDGEATYIVDEGEAPPPQAQISRIGDYDVVCELARGGMGVVYEVTSPAGSRLALKRIRQDRVAKEFQQRFLRESRVLQKLSHPGIVRVIEVSSDDVGPYIVTEFVEGRPLNEVLYEGSLRPRAAARLVADLCATVEVVHQAGVLHRDIKPSNVMIRPDSPPVLIDFGLAHVEGGDDLTRTGTLLGTPAYASPEQLTGRKGFGPHTDVYGLGGILFTSLTNRPPHEGQTLSVLLRSARDKEPRWPSKRWIPIELERLGRVALRRDPQERYQSVAELRAVLVEWLDDRQA
jgi:serine/threonine protein kinase